MRYDTNRSKFRILNRHHILAKSRNGPNETWNKLLIEKQKHAAYHTFFGRRTFKEAAEYLLRCDRAKQTQRREAWKKRGIG